MEPGDGPGARPRPAIGGHRVFKPAGGLYVQFEVFGAKGQGGGAPRVSAGLAVKTRDGRVVRDEGSGVHLQDQEAFTPARDAAAR